MVGVCRSLTAASLLMLARPSSSPPAQNLRLSICVVRFKIALTGLGWVDLQAKMKIEFSRKVK